MLAEEVQRVVRRSDISEMKAEFDLGGPVHEKNSQRKRSFKFEGETFTG